MSFLPGGVDEPPRTRALQTFDWRRSALPKMMNHSVLFVLAVVSWWPSTLCSTHQSEESFSFIQKHPQEFFCEADFGKVLLQRVEGELIGGKVWLGNCVLRNLYQI